MITLTVTIEEIETEKQTGIQMHITSVGNKSTPFERAFAMASAKSISGTVTGFTKKMTEIAPETNPVTSIRSNIPL